MYIGYAYIQYMHIYELRGMGKVRGRKVGVEIM